jgi:tetratricopeptide (TPR) repeat protein
VSGTLSERLKNEDKKTILNVLQGSFCSPFCYSNSEKEKYFKDERKFRVKKQKKLNYQITCMMLGLIIMLSPAFGHDPKENKKSEKVDYNSLSLVAISDEYLKCGDYEKSLKMANLLQDNNLKTRTLFSIGKDYYGKGENEKAVALFDETIKTIETLENPANQLSLLSDMEKTYVDKGNKDKALEILKKANEIAGSINEPGLKAFGLNDIALKMASIGERDLATTTAMSIDGFLIKYDTLIHIAQSSMKSGDEAKSSELLGLVMPEILKYENTKVKYSLYSALADLYGSIENKEKSNEMLTLALDEAGKLEFAPFISESQAELVSKYLLVGNSDKAYDIAKGITKDPYASRAIAKVAVDKAKSGHFSDAERVADTIKEDSEKYMTFASISTLYDLGDNSKKADETFDKALKGVNSITDDIDKGYAFEQIEKNLIEADQLDRALKMAKTVDVKSDKIPFLWDISKNYSKKGSGDKAIEVAEGIQDVQVKANLLTGIASDYVKASDKDKVSKLLSRVQELTNALPDDLSKSEKYIETAKIYKNDGNNKESLRLLGKAEELTKSYKVGSDPKNANKDTYEKVKAYSELASAYYVNESKDKSDEMFKEAIALLSSIKDEKHDEPVKTEEK